MISSWTCSSQDRVADIAAALRSAGFPVRTGEDRMDGTVVIVDHELADRDAVTAMIRGIDPDASTNSRVN